MANTTFNPLDKSVGITLTGSNLIATNNNDAVSGVRGAHSQTGNKFYWEVTCNINTFASNGVGASKAGNAFTSPPPLSTSVTSQCGLMQSGFIYVDGLQVGGISFGALVAGTRVCVALDLTAGRVWFRLGAAGNWNASGTANPATGVGGAAVPTLVGIAIFPASWIGDVNDTFTANFGDSAFTGAVPAGFTSGWPTVPPTGGAAVAQARVAILA